VEKSAFFGELFGRNCQRYNVNVTTNKSVGD